MVQLSLIPALEAARSHVSGPTRTAQISAAMSQPNRPTSAQINYLKKLTRIKSDGQLARFVMRKLGVDSKIVLTRQDFAKVIDSEVSEKRWAA